MKSRKKVKRAASATVPAAAVSTLRLPRQSAPLARGRSTSPFRISVAAAEHDCVACLSGCAALPPPLRATCEIVCRSVCQGRN